jgi:uncharacterized membrane protein
VTTTEPADELVRAVAAERLSFFTDAVIAIALTLLALELPLPEGTSNADLLHSAFEHREEYGAFLVSFFVIGAHWRGHHLVYRHVAAPSNALTWLTLCWLLMQVVTPFATKVLTGDGAFQARFVFYAAVQAIACLLFVLVVREVRRAGLQRGTTPPRALTLATARAGAMAGAFLVSMPLSFVTDYAFVCWLALPILHGIGLTSLRRLGRL